MIQERTRFHSMEDSLFRYLDIKIHHLLKGRDFDSIIIEGDYDRAACISVNEKRDKLFNWKRPTAKIEGKNLVIKCFPGIDYMVHYSLIKYYYYFINHRKVPKIIIRFPKGSGRCDSILLKYLSSIRDQDLVILGYVDKLIEDFPPWEGNDNFSWKKLLVYGKKVTILGCKFSYWGDIAGKVVERLAKNGVRRVIYLGKLGSLNINHIPNTNLATGSESFVGGKIVRWDNPFEGYQNDVVKFGRHFSLPSILLETKDWLAEYQDKYDFVDPEIGHMAKAANDNNISFGYMHIISDNLNKNYKEDLSNERDGNVIEKRKKLIDEVRKALAYVIKND